MTEIAHISKMAGIPTVILAVVCSTFFVGFGGGVVFPILPNLGAVLGISAFMVGVILSANRWVRLLASAPAGALVDRYGTRGPFVAGLFIEGVATLGYVIALLIPAPASVLPLFGSGDPAILVTVIERLLSPESWFLAARLCWGLGSAAVFATAYTIAADVSDGDSRGTNLAVVRGGLLLGFPSGLVLGGVVSSLAGNIAAFALAAVFALFASAVASVLVPETHVQTAERRAVKPWDIETSLPAVTIGLINFGLMFAYFGALFATLVLFLDARSLLVFGLNAQGTSGIFMAGTVLVAGAMMLVGGRLSDNQPSRVPILLAFLGVAVVGFIALAASGSLLTLALACVLIGAGQGGTSGPMMALLADLVPADRMGRASGTNNVFRDIGGGLGPLVSLPLVDLVGFAPVYFACAAIPFLAGLTLLVGVRRETGTFVPGRTGHHPEPTEAD